MRLISLSFFRVIFLLGCAAMYSCNRYIDKVTVKKSIPVYQGHIIYYPDSNVFTFKNNIGVSMDTEKYDPIPFVTKLPKGILTYRLFGSEKFAFFYKKKQVISIVIDLSNSKRKDTSFVPSIDEIDNQIRHYAVEPKDKYSLRNIEAIPERKQQIVQKGAATILFYNIEPANFDSFISTLQSFRFQ